MTSETDPAHRLTWLAVPFTFLLLIPGMFVGQLVALVYRFFPEGFILGGVESD